LRSIQQPLFTPETEWVPPDRLPDLSGHAEIAIDLETRDPNLITMGSGSVRRDGEVVGIAVAVEGWTGYFPIAHEGGGNMDRALVLDWFEEVLHTTSTKIFHNAMYDVSWIRSMGFHINGGIIDTMIAASLIDENRFSYTLDSIGKDYIGMRKNEKLLQDAAKDFGVNPKAEMWRLPAPFVGEYAEKDAEITLKLWHALQHEISKQDLWDIFNLETNLFPCLVDMKFKGVRVDVEKATAVKKQLITTEKKLLQDIKKITGFDIEIWAAASIATAFDKLKIPYDRTDKGAPSFTKNFLATHPAELPKLINEAREINKANTTFIDTILKHEHNGRIHAEINQIRSDQGGTVTGRFSYANPNLQQIPARHKHLGPLIRSLFIPEEKCIWGCFDYSQQEPRILVHFASLMKLEGTGTIVDAYKDGSADFHQMIADMAGIERKQAKTINLGIMYGMGKNKLMAELGLLKDAAEKLLKTYHQRAPFVKMLSEAVSRRADDSGKIRTIGGRLCHFDLWEPHGFGIKKPLKHADALREHGPGIKRAFTYKALNKLIQGSAADMTKQSMLALYQEGVIPHVQIHDELDISISTMEDADKIITIMEEAVELQVPNKVDFEKGDSWGDIK
jgi:DNA polymerase I-like protein with 3'-5' exonuclease and polymerase domains|tara:strand:+ start:576 stop:2432 length:1857 start_codon:yes stop_codon:yes gene_type:complete